MKRTIINIVELGLHFNQTASIFKVCCWFSYSIWLLNYIKTNLQKGNSILTIKITHISMQHLLTRHTVLSSSQRIGQSQDFRNSLLPSLNRSYNYACFQLNSILEGREYLNCKRKRSWNWTWIILRTSIIWKMANTTIKNILTEFMLSNDL